jgi:DNA-binding response OmpR family regulator
MLKFLFSRIPEDIAQPKILLIDDDRDIRTITNLVLLTQGMGNVVEPNAILLDMRLPDLSGETVLQLLRADPWTRDIPVILFTAFAGDLDRLRTLGATDIVVKPFHPQKMCDAIGRALRSRSTGDVRVHVNAAVSKTAVPSMTTGSTV